MSEAVDSYIVQEAFAKIAKQFSLPALPHSPESAPPSEQAFVRFDINFRLRTSFTIPEVFSVGTTMGNYQSISGISLAAEIAADEAGCASGNTIPGMVHSALLRQAFDCLRLEVFGLPPLDTNRLLVLMRSLGNLSIRPHEAEEFFDIREMVFAELSTVTQLSGPRRDDPQAFCREELLRLGVLPATIRYCLSQISTQRSPIAQRLLGRATMHEFLADGLLEGIETSFCRPYLFDGRVSSETYRERVAPYFLAHRDEQHSRLVECRHAANMLSLLTEHIGSFGGLEIAIKAAAQFAREQKELFESISRFAEVHTHEEEQTISPMV